MKRWRAVFRSFGILWRSVAGSGMFPALLAVPFLCGGALRFGLPRLYEVFPPAAVLRPYGGMLDAYLLLLAPYMALFASTLWMLEERDGGVCVALMITPLRRGGYLTSRFLLPAMLAACYAALIGLAFSTAARPWWHTALAALPASAVALSTLMLIPAFARDKISGMAMGKLCGLPLLTVSLPYFLPWKWQPLLSWLPTYWFVRFLNTPDWLMALMCVAVSALWCAPLLRRFFRRVALF